MATFYGNLHFLPSITAEMTDAVINVQNEKFSYALERTKNISQYSATKMTTLRGWETYLFSSSQPLMGEEIDMIGGPFPYPFYIYKNPLTGNILIGSWRYGITNHIVQALNYSLEKNLVRISVNVQEITECLLQKKQKDFFATSLQLEINSFGSKLETLSLNGSDVIGSGFLSIFNSGDFTARQTGLRTAKSNSESVRLMSTGGIQFYSDRLRDLEVCLGFVHEINGFFRNI